MSGEEGDRREGRRERRERRREKEGRRGCEKDKTEDSQSESHLHTITTRQ